MIRLDVLTKHRNALLLAEAIGWLHDYRKCSDEHLKVQAANLGKQQALPRDALANRHNSLTSADIQLPIPTPCTITNLLDDRKRDECLLLGKYLCRCHRTAHFDKQGLESNYGKQNYPNNPNDPHIKISSPFGFERDVISDLTSKLWNLPWDLLSKYDKDKREVLQQAVSDLFSQTVADTRRPINEVDLWSWGLLVGALYKAALAGALLRGNAPEARDLRWRLLGVRFKGLDYLLSAVRIPDLLARKELLTDSLNKVRELLEVTYPLGSEVYRDENGSLFVVPDVPDLLERTNEDGKKLQTFILEAFAQGTVNGDYNLQLGGEMVAHIELEQQPWWGQDPDWPRSSNDELPRVNTFLSQTIFTSADAEKIKHLWEDRIATNGIATEICTVCGLRPQGPDKRAAERNVCDICGQRRAGRSQKWATSQINQTIWTDEVADVNGRLALIVGQFGLIYWLDGSLLESLLLIENPEKPVSKTPSFSRLRRIWETTRTFWREVQDEFSQQLSDDRRRLQIHLNSRTDLSPYHVYDLLIGPTDLSVVCIPPQDNSDGYLLSADNLGYIARQLRAEVGVYTDPATAAIYVKEYLEHEFINNNRQPVLRNPDTAEGRGSANLIAGVGIAKVGYQNNRYATLIPILAEPRSFMMIVPANKSLEVIKCIKKKYEQEMGKVRDRLPLFLGCVYANRRTPIRAVLEAGRAMLDYQAQPEQWEVKSVDAQTDTNHLTLELERNSCRIQWRIPLKMGDGTTEDLWYSYFFLETGGEDSKADKHNRRVVKISKPVGNGQIPSRWIVHAADLRSSETIYLWPPRFDFEFLDTTTRRFEIAYDANGRRPRRTRPFYLEDLDRLEALWSYMKRLTKTQRHQIVRTIEATREAWYGQDLDGKSTKDEVFQQFVADTLAGAAWPQDHSWNSIPPEWQSNLIQAGVRGELTDLAELHMEILKE